MGGKGYTLIGHHELMVPLLAASVIERLASMEKSTSADALQSSKRRGAARKERRDRS